MSLPVQLDIFNYIFKITNYHNMPLDIYIEFDLTENLKSRYDFIMNHVCECVGLEVI